ncbi:MAG: hypothetical protein IJ730_04765 [Alphaproteobacteria bacterium]|nr:hypothetical protein [Alphaproteobacteria bacterium]MBR2137536.1 hypothetical protein [Alphaproteobacteria bacterium]
MKNISCIETLSIRELSKLSETDLCDLSEKISETSKWIKELSEKFEMALSAKYTEEAKKELNENGDDFGTCHLKKGAHTVTVQIPKKIQWNQEILAQLYAKLPPEDRKDIFKVTYSISERDYSKTSDILRTALEPARSSAYGKIKIIISRKDGATEDENN